MGTLAARSGRRSGSWAGHEGLDDATRIRLLTSIAFGFRSPHAVIALAMLSVGCHKRSLPRGHAEGLPAWGRVHVLVWSVGEDFGGPYPRAQTDVGTGIIYTLLFLALFAVAPSARRERLSLNRVLVA